MALIKCSECGREISDKAACCPNCGCPASVIIENASRNNLDRRKRYQEKEKGSNSMTPKKGNNGKKIALIAGILVVLVITLAFAFLIDKDRKGTSNDINNDINVNSSQLTTEKAESDMVVDEDRETTSTTESVTTTETESASTFSLDARPIDGKEYQHDGFVYILYDDNSIEITKYSGNDDSVAIYEEINGYAVSRIGDAAFEDCAFIENIYLYANIISIGDCAFKGCTSLEYFKIPEGMISVGKSAFENCTSLKYVYVYSDNVTFGVNAFANCPKLEKIPEGAYNDYS